MDQDIRKSQTSVARAPSRVGLIGSQLSDSVAKEKAAIDHELSALANELDYAHVIVGDLEGRVAPVSSPPSPSTEPPSHDYIGASQVYDRLHNAVSTMHTLQERLTSVLRHLEV
jgi:hypothetical protein